MGKRDITSSGQLVKELNSLKLCVGDIIRFDATRTRHRLLHARVMKCCENSFSFNASTKVPKKWSDKDNRKDKSFDIPASGNFDIFEWTSSSGQSSTSSFPFPKGLSGVFIMERAPEPPAPIASTPTVIAPTVEAANAAKAKSQAQRSLTETLSIWVTDAYEWVKNKQVELDNYVREGTLDDHLHELRGSVQSEKDWFYARWAKDMGLALAEPAAKHVCDLARLVLHKMEELLIYLSVALEWAKLWWSNNFGEMTCREAICSEARAVWEDELASDVWWTGAKLVALTAVSSSLLTVGLFVVAKKMTLIA